MNGLVDYAGLFPPAGLDMVTAVNQYAGFQNQPEAWMLGRFIAPADRLGELAAAVENAVDEGGCWGVSALLGHREDSDQSLAMLAAQCEAIADFETRLAGRAAVEVLEIPIPALMEPADLPNFLMRYLRGLEKSCNRRVDVFWEIPPGAPESMEYPYVEAISKAGASSGIKLRCGGLTPEAFPSVGRVARIVALCRDLDLPLKLTAGLHHPVRHQATEPAVMMHGFLNVFGAGVLAHALRWDAQKLSKVIADTDPASFGFDAGVFSWQGHTVQTDTLELIRSRFLCGFGSCSFDEPRDDLKKLGLL